jgi:hypothetical protein
MKDHKLLIFAAVTTLCCIAIACTLFAVFGLGLLAENELPLYTFEQVPSAHEGYLRTTLTSGSTIYVMDYEEYALVAATSAPTEMIGRFPVIIGNSGLYAIPGQDPSAYVLEFDPMYQQVHRNINHPPFDWVNADFQKLRVMFLTANPKETEDADIIHNVHTALIGAAIMIVPFQQDGNYSGYENYTLLLFSDELPGLMYAAGLHIAPDGSVYLAENMVSNVWHPAGMPFRNWLQDR